MPTCPECGSEDIDLAIEGWVCCECGCLLDDEDVLLALGV